MASAAPPMKPDRTSDAAGGSGHAGTRRAAPDGVGPRPSVQIVARPRQAVVRRNRVAGALPPANNSAMTLVHIIAGLLAILTGAVALSAPKGGTLHRKSGIVFVCAMLVMSSLGAWIAAMMVMAGDQPHIQSLNVIAGSVTFSPVT